MQMREARRPALIRHARELARPSLQPGNPLHSHLDKGVVLDCIAAAGGDVLGATVLRNEENGHIGGARHRGSSGAQSAARWES